MPKENYIVYRLVKGATYGGAPRDWYRVSDFTKNDLLTFYSTHRDEFERGLLKAVVLKNVVFETAVTIKEMN